MFPAVASSKVNTLPPRTPLTPTEPPKTLLRLNINTAIVFPSALSITGTVKVDCSTEVPVRRPDPLLAIVIVPFVLTGVTEAEGVTLPIVPNLYELATYAAVPS